MNTEEFMPIHDAKGNLDAYKTYNPYPSENVTHKYKAISMIKCKIAGRWRVYDSTQEMADSLGLSYQSINNAVNHRSLKNITISSKTNNNNTSITFEEIYKFPQKIGGVLGSSYKKIYIQCLIDNLNITEEEALQRFLSKSEYK
jgi:hypothetical protein